VVGNDTRLLQALPRLLDRAGRQEGDAVVLGAAGSSHAHALSEVEHTATRLARLLNAPVEVGHAATARPTVAEAVARARERGARRVAVASWLLAPGLFHARMAEAGAEVVSDPLCADDAVARVVLERYREYCRR
jgi:sirohydrochlorin ferrochelatase